MSRKKRNAKIRGGQFTPIPLALLKSHVWALMSGSEVKVFMELRGAWQAQTWGGERDDNFSLPYENITLAPAKVSKALKSLERFGLIEKAVPGGLRGTGGGSTRYRMPAAKWREYKPAPQERDRLARMNLGRKQRKARNRQRATSGSEAVGGLFPLCFLNGI